MKASAIEENERETVIQILDGKASVFTGSLPVFRKLTRLGWKETSDATHYAWLEGPAKGISFRRVGKPTRTLKVVPKGTLDAARASLNRGTAKQGGRGNV